MDFTLMELKLLTNSIVTELIRISEKKNCSERDKEKIAMLEELGNRIDDEKIRLFKERSGK